ncbi:hypothetical protein KCU78_g11337, partial [Aureobasidium melanogenum]
MHFTAIALTLGLAATLGAAVPVDASTDTIAHSDDIIFPRPLQFSADCGLELKTWLSLFPRTATAGTSARPSSPTTPLPHIRYCINPILPQNLHLKQARMCRRKRFTYQGCSHEFIILTEQCDKAKSGQPGCVSVVFFEQLEGFCRACREQQERDAWPADYNAGMKERRLADEARDKANKDQAEEK